MRSSKVTRWLVVAATAAAFALSVLVSGGTTASASGATSNAEDATVVDSTGSPTFQADDWNWF